MIYTVLLDNNKIGTTLLENADAPMGVVFGKLIDENNLICYNFLSKYCKDNGIDTTEFHITYSYGAGECIGYCETKFEIHSSCIVKTERGWASGGDTTKYPRRVNILPIDSLEYDSLIQSLNAGFYFLPDVIGCPDCNDGGWAEIIVATPETTKSISFPFGRSIPEIEPFLRNIKSLTNK